MEELFYLCNVCKNSYNKKELEIIEKEKSRTIKCKNYEKDESKIGQREFFALF